MENKNKHKIKTNSNKQKHREVKEDFLSAEEDALLASSQESDSAAQPVNAKPSNPDLPTTSKAALSALGSTSQSAKRKTKSSGVTLKARYKRAVFILDKIAKNAAAGTVHPKDEEDGRNCKEVVEEYKKYLNSNPSSKTEAVKRGRSKDDSAAEPDGKRTDTKASPHLQEPPKKRRYDEVARDHLQVALVDEVTGSGKPVQEKWVEIESKLSERVSGYLFENPDNPIPGFDSSESLRGCRIFKCRDGFSREFLGKCVAELGNAWEGLKVKLIPAAEIPRRPRARIWLPKMAMDSEKLVRLLQRQNPNIPMTDWTVICAEKPLEGALSSSYLLRLNDECIDPLRKVDNKLFFGVRTAKIKIFRSNETIPKANVEDANQLLGDMSLKGDASEDAVRSANQVSAENLADVDEGCSGKS